MNTDLIQRLREKLQRRVRRLNAVSWRQFHATLKQWWSFIHTTPLLEGILKELIVRFPDLGPAVDRQTSRENTDVITFDDECENAAFGYLVMKHCAESTDEMAEVQVGYNLSTEDNESAVSAFRIAFVEPLYEYLDEQMDDQRAILALLRRYKHKCESFQRRRLYDLWNSDTSKGEENLAFHLYEYMHDQGVNLTIEPYSESGCVDMVAAQNSDDPLIADAKIL